MKTAILQFVRTLLLHWTKSPQKGTGMSMMPKVSLICRRWLSFDCFPGPDDMPAHIKSTVVGCSLNIPSSLTIQCWICIDIWQFGRGLCYLEHGKEYISMNIEIEPDLVALLLPCRGRQLLQQLLLILDTEQVPVFHEHSTLLMPANKRQRLFYICTAAVPMQGVNARKFIFTAQEGSTRLQIVSWNSCLLLPKVLRSHSLHEAPQPTKTAVTC